MCDPSSDTACLGAIATLGSAIAALIAACITAWMAIETRRMATAANRSLTLQYQPLLGIRNVTFELGVPQHTETESPVASNINCLCFLSVGLELFNAGQVVIFYKMNEMRVSFANRTAEEGRWLSRSGQILPGSSIVFKHPPIELDPPISAFPAKGRISAVFTYFHDESQAPKQLRANMEYVIGTGPQGFVTSFTYIDDEPAV
jgi:hypothetical protein